MLKYNFASRFFFTGIGFCITLALPVVVGSKIASQYYTVIMALNLFSGWFGLSFRQKFYVDIQKSDRGEIPRPTRGENVASKAVTFALLVASAFVVPFVVPSIAGIQGAFFLGLLASYLISISYVSLWCVGKLYISYALEASITVIVFLTIVVLREPNFFVAFIFVFVVAVAAFVRVGLSRWLNTARGPKTTVSQILSQLIAVASFAEVVFFDGIELASDIVIYRVTLSFITVVAIIFGVIRQWDIFQNTVVPNQWRSKAVFAAAIGVMLAGYGAFIFYPPALFMVLVIAALAQQIAARDQFLVIKDSQSLALVFGYVISLSLTFGGAYLLSVTDLYSLLLFKIILIASATLVPTSVVLIYGIRETEKCT